MNLPPYTKTVVGALTVFAAAVGLHFHLITLNDAVEVAMGGFALMGVGIRHAVGKAAQKGGGG